MKDRDWGAGGTTRNSTSKGQRRELFKNVIEELKRVARV